MGRPARYAPIRVRLLSALRLGAGTMAGQGGGAELAGSAPIPRTVTSGIAGTMAAGGRVDESGVTSDGEARRKRRLMPIA